MRLVRDQCPCCMMASFLTWTKSRTQASLLHSGLEGYGRYSKDLQSVYPALKEQRTFKTFLVQLILILLGLLRLSQTAMQKSLEN